LEVVNYQEDLKVSDCHIQNIMEKIHPPRGGQIVNSQMLLTDSKIFYRRSLHVIR